VSAENAAFAVRPKKKTTCGKLPRPFIFTFAFQVVFATQFDE
jgi:hypothetical protein